MANASISYIFLNGSAENTLNFTIHGVPFSFTTSASQFADVNSNNLVNVINSSSISNNYVAIKDTVSPLVYQVTISALNYGSEYNLSPQSIDLNGNPEVVTLFEVFNVPPCDLSILSISTTNDINAQGIGSITINAYSSFIKEYSLDGVTYQSSNIFSNKTSGSYTVRVRDYNGCIVSANVTINNTACSLSISSYSKTNETAPDANDGTITVEAASGASGIQFSLDGGAFQGVGLFTGIAPGVHTVYVKDSANCTISQNFTIEEAPDVEPVEPVACFDPVIGFSSANPIEFKIVKCDTNQSESLFGEEDICAVYKDCFYQTLNCSDTITFQMLYEDVEFATLPVLKVINLLNNAVIDSVDFVSLGGGWYQMEKLVSDIPNICEKHISLVVKSKSSYNPNEYYTHAQSEPIFVSQYHNCNLKLEYWNESDYAGMVYEGNEGYRNQLRIFAQFWKTSHPQEKEVYRKSNGELVKLSEEITKKVKFETGYLPAYIHEKIALALSHDHVRINNVEYVLEEDYKEDEPEDRYALYKGEAALTHKTYYKKNLIK